MSDQIAVAHVEQYRANVVLLAQQKGSRFMRLVRNDGSIVGRTTYYDRIGQTAAIKRSTRHADTPQVNTPHSRRRADLEDYDWADLIDGTDLIRMLIDPTSAYAMSGGFALGRAADDVIIAAANGSAFEGQSGGTDVPLPSAQKVPVAGAGMNLAKILAAKEILDAADVDPELKRYMVVKSAQITDLLNVTEIKDSNYNTVKALAMGEMNTYAGFEFIRSERLTTDSSSDVLCLAFTEQALGISMGQDIQVKVTERADKNYATQVWANMSIAAVRVEDAQLVQIACNP